MEDEFDVLVLGAGPGGYTAAVRAAQLGMRVAIVEERLWGGICLNVGCVPSKALIHSANMAQMLASAKEHGLHVDGTVRVDYGAAHARSRSIAEGRAKGVHYLMRKNGIEEIEGRGVFTGPHELEVRPVSGPAREVTFSRAIIAVGAQARTIPGIPLSDRIVTYRELILAPQLPSSIVIAGAGAIGVEFAYILKNFGVDVTLVEVADRVVPLEDPDVSKELSRRYRRLGIKVLTAARILDVAEDADHIQVTVGTAEKQQTLRAEMLLQAVGFRPRIEGYGLETTGAEISSNGGIRTDSEMRTSVPHIFAIGDVTSKLMLAHAAEAMGTIAAETMAGIESRGLDYAMVPRATYSSPQIASFGLTESQAADIGVSVRASVFPLQANAKAHAVGESSGFVKLVVGEDDGRLMGAHMVGPDVTELLPELTLAQAEGIPISRLARNVHAHPTLSEAVKEAVHLAAGHCINL